MSKIVIKNLEKTFGDNKVINNFNIDINDGEFIVLVGPSGCGKSTLLRMISGLESINQGEIFFERRVPPFAFSQMYSERHKEPENMWFQLTFQKQYASP